MAIVIKKEKDLWLVEIKETFGFFDEKEMQNYVSKILKDKSEHGNVSQMKQQDVLREVEPFMKMGKKISEELVEKIKKGKKVL